MGSCLFFVFARTNELLSTLKVIQLGLKNPSSSSSLYFGPELFALLFCRNCQSTLGIESSLVEVVQLELGWHPQTWYLCLSSGCPSFFFFYIHSWITFNVKSSLVKVVESKFKFKFFFFPFLADISKLLLVPIVTHRLKKNPR